MNADILFLVWAHDLHVFGENRIVKLSRYGREV